MEQHIVKLLAAMGKHVLTGLLHGVRIFMVTGVVVFLVVAATTEAVGALLTHGFPTGPTHLAAAALAVAFGYAAAVTVAIGELLRVGIKTIELIVDEAEKLEKKAVEEVEVLAHKAEEEGLHLGHAAISDAGALSRGVAGVAGAMIGGAEHEAESIEHGIASHLPGHHNS